MEQGASQCKQIEKLLTLGEMLDFDCANAMLQVINNSIKANFFILILITL